MRKTKKKKKETLDEIADDLARYYEMQLRMNSAKNLNDLEKIKDPDKYIRKDMSVRAQSGQKDKFREGIINSGIYIDKILLILEQESVPRDLAALIFVESMFNPNAGSGAGAKGLWQLSEDAAKKKYDDKDESLISWRYDRRTDPLSSTRKAAKILKNNYNELGTWDFAILAYNYGSNGTRRSKEEYNNNFVDVIMSHNTDIFSFASKNFYSEFLAALYVWKNHERFFGKLELKEPQNITEIVYIVRSGDNLSLIASRYNISLYDIMKQNNLKTDLIQVNQKLMIPVDEDYINIQEQSKDESKQIQQPIISTTLEGYLVPTSFDTYKVKENDTLSEIAGDYNISLQKLMFLNGLNNRSTISINQQLLIPNNTQPNQDYFIHTVKRGHTLSGIVDFYITHYDLDYLRINQIKSLNHLRSDNITLNQKLKIPLK